MKKQLIVFTVIVTVFLFISCTIDVKITGSESALSETSTIDTSSNDNSSIDTSSDELLFDTVNRDITAYFREYFRNSDSYVRKEINIFGMSSEGGIAESYTMDGEIKMIRLYLYGELGKSQSDYYIINENTIYEVVTITEYNKPFYMDFEVTRIYSKDYFIINDKVMVYDDNIKDLMESEDNVSEYTAFADVMEKVKNSD